MEQAKTIDLRIGNLVFESYGGEYQVESIHNAGFLDLKKPNYTAIGRYAIESCRYIPLTEDYLFRFGAEKHFDKVIYGRFSLNYKSNYKYWYVTDLESNCYMTKVEFVHEWQNFIHAIDGNELILKNS